MTNIPTQEILVIGRGVYTLPLLRILGSEQEDTKKNNVKVTLATTVGWKDVAAANRFVDRVVTVPRPDRDLEGWTDAICEIARSKRDNLVIIPVIEETLFLSLPKVKKQILESSPTNTRIWVSAHETLMQLNDKFQFQKCVANLFGEDKIPQTSLVHNQKDLVKAVGDCFAKNKAATKVVLKPLASHGSIGNHMIRREDFECLSTQELLRQYPIAMEESSERNDNPLTVPYVAQEFVEGHEYCTLSLCLNGKVVAHVCYKPRFAGTLGFSPIRDLAPPAVWKKSLEYVQTVASKLQLTGHFGFDVIQRFNGELAGLECNPRVTNGLAFLAPRFSAAIAAQMKATYLGSVENGNQQIISPTKEAHIMTTLTVAGALARAKNNSERMAMLEVAVTSHDDVWWGRDPLPIVTMVLRIVFTVVYAMLQLYILRPLAAGIDRSSRQTVSEYIKQKLQDEIVSFDQPSERSSRNTTLETVGGFNVDNARSESKGLRVLVTGATGFLGGRVVRALNQGWDDKTIPLPEAVKSVTEITATGRNEEKGRQLLASLDQTQVKAQFKVADLSNTEETYNLVKNHDVVIHCAALCSLWTRWDDYIAANTTATENIAQACQLSGVGLLVHISSPSLCIPINAGDRVDVKETDPLPPDSEQANRYSTTKKWAEDIVQDVSKRYNLPSIILRPRAIFGPGDTTLFPLLLDRLKSGKLGIVGNGHKCVGDYTYVDNVVAACLCCLGKSPASLKVYAITNDDSRRFLDVVHQLCDQLKLQRPWKRIPRPVAYTVASVMEGFSALAMLAGYKIVPLFTRYSVNVISLSCTFDISAAKHDLGYKPVVSFDEGCNRFLDSVDH